MTDIIKDWWAAILALVSFVAWLVRMESKTKANEREIQRLWEQRKEDLAHADKARDAQNSILAEMRADIKLLLQRQLKE